MCRVIIVAGSASGNVVVLHYKSRNMWLTVIKSDGSKITSILDAYIRLPGNYAEAAVLVVQHLVFIAKERCITQNTHNFGKFPFIVYIFQKLCRTFIRVHCMHSIGASISIYSSVSIFVREVYYHAKPIPNKDSIDDTIQVRWIDISDADHNYYTYPYYSIDLYCREEEDNWIVDTGTDRNHE